MYWRLRFRLPIMISQCCSTAAQVAAFRTAYEKAMGEQRVLLQAVRAHLALRQEQPAAAAARERACMLLATHGAPSVFKPY